MKLYTHQQKALNMARERSLALYHECGTGKTATMLHVIKHHKMKGIGPALVVCPLSIIEAAWIEDCDRFTPDLSIINCHSKKPAERKLRLAEEYDIYVMNYETFKYLWQDIVNKGFDVIIVDESSKMKDATSQVSRALLATAGIRTRGKGGKTYLPYKRPIPYRYVMSGTPAPNDKSEYWAQIKFITGPGNELFHDNFYAFRSHFFYSIPIGRTGYSKWEFRRAMAEEFKQQMLPVVDVVSKADAIDLPDQVREIRSVELSAPERKAYDQLKKDLVLRFKDETILATSALVEILLLRELTSGFCYVHKDNGMKVVHQFGKSKLNELKALLEEIGDKQTIVWVNFRFEVELLLKNIPNSAALWGGCEDREKVIKDFQQGKTKTLICIYQAAAHGLSFVNCSYAIYFSMTYSYEMLKQSEDRIHRIGTEKKVTYYSLLAKDTIDQTIHKVVNKKGKMSEEVLNFLRDNNNV